MSSTGWLILFGVGLGWLGYVYIGYPVLMWLCGLRRDRHLMRDEFLPSVSVLIAAHNEEKDIGWKVTETLQWDYPTDSLEVMVASDSSEDRTDEILQNIYDPRLTFVRMPERGGKNVALNRLSKLAQGGLLFFTDANSHIDAGCLRHMVRHFWDPRVGCVTGVEHSLRGKLDHAIGCGGRAYLGYESLINQLESRVGSVLVCDGSIFLIRRSLFTQLQPELANDLELPMRIGHRGYRILYEPTARSTERATRSVGQEFARRRRICGQGVLGMWRLRKCLRGLRSLQFVSRKFLRWLTLIPLLLVLISSISLATTLPWKLLVGLEVVFYALGLTGWVLAICGPNGGRLVALPFYFLLANTAALMGVLEACFGRRFHVWEIASLSRGPDEAVGYQLN
jgi:cellulose synthase/poly-beta-1,6-N-acetylglucosamine synthase-like glycosyltransferase